VNHVIWQRNLLYDLKLSQLEATEIRVDNKSAIKSKMRYEKVQKGLEVLEEI
jgi:hypothetical protein